MPNLDELPVEMLAHVALFANKPRYQRSKNLKELLALRCASRSCKDAVVRAITQHRAVKHLSAQGKSDQSIVVIGRVFGSGCRVLNVSSVLRRIRPTNFVSALQTFVTSTNGQLRTLTYTGERSLHFSTQDLLEMCRGCPLLTCLMVERRPSHQAIITADNLDDFASAAGSACPLLESVWLPCSQSAAEGYQWCFPRLKCLSFCGLDEIGRDNAAGPVRWDKIELTLQTCVHATEVELFDETVSPRLVDLILAAPAAGRLKSLYLGADTVISPESILQFARGLGALSELHLPDGLEVESAFYSALVQARPAIAKLGLGCGNRLRDDELRIICDGLPLEHLELLYVVNLTDRAIDIILESRCAQSIRSIEVSGSQFSPACVLRLLRGCPKLANFDWEIYRDHPSPIEHGQNVDEINALLKSRGGEPITVFPMYGPNRTPRGPLLPI